MQFVGRFVRFVASLAVAILGPVLLVVAGALLAGLGLHWDWMWLVYAGLFVAAIGAVLVIRLWE